jgi:hypothetical protein
VTLIDSKSVSKRRLQTDRNSVAWGKIAAADLVTTELTASKFDKIINTKMAFTTLP